MTQIPQTKAHSPTPAAFLCVTQPPSQGNPTLATVPPILAICSWEGLGQELKNTFLLPVTVSQPLRPSRSHVNLPCAIPVL